MLADILGALVAAAMIAVAAVALLRERVLGRATWQQHQAAFRRYQSRVLPRELFRRWRPTLRLTHGARDEQLRPAPLVDKREKGEAGTWPARWLTRRRIGRAL